MLSIRPPIVVFRYTCKEESTDSTLMLMLTSCGCERPVASAVVWRNWIELMEVLWPELSPAEFGVMFGGGCMVVSARPLATWYTIIMGDKTCKKCLSPGSDEAWMSTYTNMWQEEQWNDCCFYYSDSQSKEHDERQKRYDNQKAWFDTGNDEPMVRRAVLWA